eukprot:29855-Pelagococcus_subviridis.AAC.4
MNGRPPPSIRTSMSSLPAALSFAPSARRRRTTTASSDVCTLPSPTVSPSATHGDCGTPRAHFRYRPPTYTGAWYVSIRHVVLRLGGDGGTATPAARHAEDVA